MLRKIALATAVLVTIFAIAASASPVSKGTCLLSFQVSNGTADLYDPTGATTSGYITAYDHSEIGAGIQFWKLMSEDYAFTIGGGLGFFSEENEPGTAALPLSPTDKYTQNSFSLRVGGDRVVGVGDRAILFFGPGIEYWSGKAKFESGSTSVETESVSRISLSGRIGTIMTIGSNWGLGGEIGHKIGHASAEDNGAKATWWPSSLDARGGLFLMFGGGGGD